jgi:hypothetical protein
MDMSAGSFAELMHFECPRCEKILVIVSYPSLEQVRAAAAAGRAEAVARPGRDEIVQLVADHMYGGRILNNAHRGEVVEMMVLAALGDEWKHVGLGWHPWDLQRGRGGNRIRVQVKQTAAVQLWGKSVSRSLNFGWKPNPPSYFARDNPGEEIEAEGWFCDLFVFGIHDEEDPSGIDQADPAQWMFMVVPVCDIAPGTNRMSLSKARLRWAPVPWERLRAEVERKI